MTPDDPNNPTPTAAHVTAHARARPDAIAIIDGESSWTYAEFDRDIARLANLLQAFSLQARDIVAVEWGAPYSHFALTLALESLGLTATSFVTGDIPHCQWVFDNAALVLTQPGSPTPKTKRVHTLSSDWLEEQGDTDEDNRAEAHARRTLDANAPVRLLMGTGTTGFPKIIAVTAEGQEYRLREKATQMNLDEHSRTIHEMPFNVAGEFFTATACLRAGGACIWDRTRSIPDAIVHHGATHGTVIIGSLMQSLAGLSADFEKPNNFSLRTFGGPLTEDLRRQALDRLADDICSMYGTNEIPGIAYYLASDGIGDIRPEVDVEILDENGEPTIGAASEIRLRAPYMAKGYLNDAEATDEKFRDGWFYPGDHGVMPEPGKLKVLGRNDDLINIGGLKVHPAAFELSLGAIDGVTEACLTSLPPSAGKSGIYICLVLEKDRDAAETINRVKTGLSPVIATAHLRKVHFLPKTQNGKIRRNEVKTLLMDGLAAEADAAK